MVKVKGKANGLILDLKSRNVKDGALLFVSGSVCMPMCSHLMPTGLFCAWFVSLLLPFCFIS